MRTISLKRRIKNNKLYIYMDKMIEKVLLQVKNEILTDETIKNINEYIYEKTRVYIYFFLFLYTLIIFLLFVIICKI